MMPKTAYCIAALFAGLSTAHADDGRALKRGGNRQAVSISGASSGAAMAMQYAVAHSGNIGGVGSIAGPGWGCAEGKISQAINDCMCGRKAPSAKIDLARQLADRGDIDPLVAGKPKALQRSYVFHSVADRTVVDASAQANIDFLRVLTGNPPVIDRGNSADGSIAAGHGILSPEGSDSCRAGGVEGSYVRNCGNADNAGSLFLALYGQGGADDPKKRVARIPDGEVWSFDQQALIDEVKKGQPMLAADRHWLGFPYKSTRRDNFDLAPTGYLYVPPGCRRSDSHCRIHVALHGCKQDAKTYATTAGYNNWAEHYQVIVIYPAVRPDVPASGDVCSRGPIPAIADSWWVEPNPNGCWDWWGYLDGGVSKNRYLTRQAPQMQVIERIIAEATRPLR